MRILKPVFLHSLAFFGLIATANATVRIHIDLSAQEMHVESFCGNYSWPVSTARSGYYTPPGDYALTGMQRNALLAQISHVPDALFNLFQGRLRHSRKL